MSAAPTILHIVGSLEGGGAERWVRELVPRLNSRGMRAEIATVYEPRLTEAGLVEIGCPVYHRPKHRGFDPVHFAWLRNLIAQRKPTIVHTHQWAGKYVGRAAAILARTPVIVHTEHSPISVSPAERIFSAAFAPFTARVIAFNEDKARLIGAREHVSRFEIIRNGLPLRPAPSAAERTAARRGLELSDSTVAFGVVASLQQRKNPSLALRAFARIVDEPGSAKRLDFFGDGVLRASLEEEARSLGIFERVRFHGFRSDVRDLLPGLDVFLTVATAEMAPISMLEAMAAKLPLIGVPHAGTVEMIQDGVNGLVVSWSAEKVASAMRVLAHDAALRGKFGAAGRAIVELDYDIERIADQHVALYEQLMRIRSERSPRHLSLTSP